MKELTIEEKAKRYDEALKVLHKYDGANIMFTQDLKEEMFPELKESEDESENEKIRKTLIHIVKGACDKYGIKSRWKEINEEKLIAWLEQQGKPQVRTGIEWVNAIDNACDERYTEEYSHGEYCHEQSFKWGFQEGVEWLEKQGETFTKKDVDDAYLKGITDTKNEIEKQHEATYQIRKDIASFIFNYRGNIKDRAKWINYLGIKVSFVEKQGEHKPTIEMKTPEESLGIDSETYNKIVDECIYGEQKPADKVESKFKVGQTIKKEGFNSGFPIVKIENGFYYNDMGDNFPFTDQDNWKLVEQKPADWSEEDEDMRDTIIRDLKRLGGDIVNVNPAYKAEIDWLKSLKDRVQPKQEWSEEDSRILYNVKAYIGYAAGQSGVKDELFKEANEWLNSLPIGFIYSKNYNEDMVTLLVSELKQIANDNNVPEQYQMEINWLKSLKPQKQWKPSELQIEALESATANCAYSEYEDCLKELIGQLKELKG